MGIKTDRYTWSYGVPIKSPSNTWVTGGEISPRNQWSFITHLIVLVRSKCQSSPRIVKSHCHDYSFTGVVSEVHIQTSEIFGGIIRKFDPTNGISVFFFD